MSEITNAQFAAGLREMADFYEVNPEAPRPHTPFGIYCTWRKEFIMAAAALATGGVVKKWADPADESYSRYYATRNFGVVAVQASIDRKQVCRLVTPAVYDCPDSGFAQSADVTKDKYDAICEEYGK